MVRGVAEGGPAAEAGLASDDVITDVDGEPVDSMPGLVVEIREHEPGDEVDGRLLARRPATEETDRRGRRTPVP